MKYSFVLVLILLKFNGLAQDTLLFMNGEKRLVQEYSIVDSSTIQFKNMKGKLRTLDNDELFSIKSAKGSERLFYKPQGTYEIGQMRDFLAGEVEARNSYHSKFSFISAAVLGAAAPFVIQSYAYPVIPLVYSISIGLVRPRRIPEGNDYYKLGYKEIAQRKRTKNALLGSLLGLVVGTSTFYLTR